MASAEPNLKELLLKAKKNQVDHETTATLGPLRCGLKQIANGTADLMKRLSEESQVGSDKLEMAKGMLARQNFDSDTLRRSLQSLSMRPSQETVDLVNITDVQGYLQNEYQKLIGATLSEAENKTIEAFHERCNERLQRDWKEERGAVVSDMTVRPASAKASTVLRIQPGATLAQYQQALATYMKSPQRRDAVGKFISTCSHIPTNKKLEKCWLLLQKWNDRMVACPNLRPKKPTPTAFLNTATLLLEREYSQYLRDRMGWESLSINRLAEIAGATGEKEWAELFLLLRAGEGIEWERDTWAQTLVEGSETWKAASNPHISKAPETRQFCQGARGDRGVAGSAMAQGGPMERLVRGVLAGSTRFSEYWSAQYLRTIEDFMWVVLVALRGHKAADIASNTALETLGAKQSVKLFHVLFFSGQFEKALDQLEGTDFFPDVVHIAIALQELDLLPSPVFTELHDAIHETTVSDKADKDIVLVQQYLRCIMFDSRYSDPYLASLHNRSKPAFKATLVEAAQHRLNLDEILSLLDPQRWLAYGENVSPDLLQSVARDVAFFLKGKGHITSALRLFDKADEGTVCDMNIDKIGTLVDSLRLMLLSETGTMAPTRVSSLPTDPVVLAAFKAKGNAPNRNVDLYYQLCHLCVCIEILYYSHTGASAESKHEKINFYKSAFQRLDEQWVLPRPHEQENPIPPEGEGFISTPELNEWLLLKALGLCRELLALDDQRKATYGAYAQRLFQSSSSLVVTQAGQAEVLRLYQAFRY